MKVYNSLTHTKDQIIPLSPEKITIYVCGITPYDTTHLGHAFTYISFDALIKYLKYKGHTVEYTQNVTDINDRDNDILKRAQELNIPWQELADYWTKRFLDDMEQLNWTKPNHYLKASENLSVMITLVQKLINKKCAYQKNGSVYLDISKDKSYGKLSRLSNDEMLKIATNFDEDIKNPDKKHPLDITLWRAASFNQPAHIPSFDSPFGKGRPGWHIECSAMSMEYLGEQIDIHGGGIDLIFPHHEAEIAQSENATGKVPFVKYWMHTGAVFYQKEKMSKSLGNLVMVSKLLEKYSANAIRWVLLSHHWHQDWEFRESELKDVTQKLSVIASITKQSSYNKNQIEIAASPLAPSSKRTSFLEAARNDIIERFEQAMENNLDTPKALEIILETVRNKSAETPTIRLMLDVLGFKF